MDEMDSAGKVLAQHLSQVLDVGQGVEHRLELVKKPGRVQLDVPKILRVLRGPVVGISG